MAKVAKVAAAGGGTAVFSYDPNGNQTSGDGRTITFDLMDRVASVTQTASGTTTAFAYAPDGARFRQVVSGGAEGGKFGPKTIYYVDKEYELAVWADGTTEERSYVGSAVIYRKGGAREVRYQHLDRLGSLDAVTGDDAAATELLQDAHGFDPWGKPRGREWTSSGDRLHPAGDLPAQAVTTDRGFTGHEHLDVHWLIHMNGRVYDYRLGRFLSVDPIISNPANPQAVNPYSYIGNNPLSGTDPTGYDACPAGGKTGEGGCKPNSMIEARRQGSIAGRAGDNVTVNGHDQNTSAGQAIIAGSKTNGGGSSQGSKPNNTNATNEGSPTRTARKGEGDGVPPLLRRPDAEGSTSSTMAPRGFYDRFGVRHDTFCMSCHDGTPTAEWEKQQSRLANEWQIFIGQQVAGVALGAYVGLVMSAEMSGAMGVAASGDHIVLGLESYGLKQTALGVGGRTLMGDAEWQATLRTALGTPSTRFTVSLDGVSGASPYSQFMTAAQRGLTPGASPFNWRWANSISPDATLRPTSCRAAARFTRGRSCDGDKHSAVLSFLPDVDIHRGPQAIALAQHNDGAVPNAR